MHDEKIIRRMAEERIERLLALAYKRSVEGKGTGDELAKRYIKLAQEISSHYKVSMKKPQKNSFCKRCNAVLIPGRTCTVRIESSNGYIAYICGCGSARKAFYRETA
jgi:ribonuclease P protein subunit RPR2